MKKYLCCAVTYMMKRRRRRISAGTKFEDLPEIGFVQNGIGKDMLGDGGVINILGAGD